MACIDIVPLPTLESLNAVVPQDLNSLSVARQWFLTFSSHIQSRNINQLCDECLIPTAVWRDLLALTWDFRVFRHSKGKISTFLESQLQIFQPQEFKLREQTVNFQQPYPDLAFISAIFDFRTIVGTCSGVARLVPTQSGNWKAHALLTNLEGLQGHPEKIGPLRNFQPNHGLWEHERAREREFNEQDPQVVIIGAGQSGLVTAARLRALGVSVLILEKNERVGDNWRNRYDALCLHDPVWFDHMPYIPFPPTWPVYTPARKLANWLEHYAEALEIPVWTSTVITSATQTDDGKWHIDAVRENGSRRQLVVNHLVFATGFGGGSVKESDYPGLDKFKGKYMHSTQHKRASDHLGKKVVVVGSGNSAHDIAKDFCDHGIDVTMVQRNPTYVRSGNQGWEFLFKGGYWEGGPPTEVVDLVSAALPRQIAVGLLQRKVRGLAELDRDILDSLRGVGFKVSYGELDCGFALSAVTGAGGHYIDVGASQLVIDGKIKLKNDSTISEITETGLKFVNGSDLDADVVIFATGLSDARQVIRTICGDAIADKTKPLWNLDAEGEINSVWRDTGVKNMWSVFGNLAMCRFNSKHLALQIKAIEEGVFGKRYSLEN